MSDIYKWLEIVSNVLRQDDSTSPPGLDSDMVIISDKFGGGVGKVISYSDDGSMVTVDAKGQHITLPVSEVSDAVDPSVSYYNNNTAEQHYDEVDSGEHCLRDKPEFRAGDVVKIDGLYGAGNGEGYGVFQSYSLDGQTALCNVDSKIISLPVEVLSHSEEHACNDFEDTNNDGSLSPMSYGEDNRLEIQKEDAMNDLEKWIKIVEGEITSDENETVIEEGECGCLEYDCPKCFPPISESETKNDSFGEFYEEFISECDETLMDEEFDDELEEKWDKEVEVDPREKGKYSNKTISELEQELSKLKKSGPHHKGSPEYEKEKELQFAIRAKRHWGKVNEDDMDDIEMSDLELDDDDVDITDFKGNKIDTSNARYLSNNESIHEDDIESDLDVIDYPEDDFDDEDALNSFGEFDPKLDIDVKSTDDENDVAFHDPEEDVSDLIGQIIYAQDVGFSNSPRTYSADDLMRMKPEMVRRIYNKVVGESVEEEVDEAFDEFPPSREDMYDFMKDAERQEREYFDNWDEDDYPEGEDIYSVGEPVSYEDEFGSEIDYDEPEAPELIDPSALGSGLYRDDTDWDKEARGRFQKAKLGSKRKYARMESSSKKKDI